MVSARPKVTLRHKPTRDSTLYVGYSRGFRSGGFNQTGVGAAGIAGVNDLFDAETANTYEAGAKADFLDRRVGANVSVYHTQAKGSYFFVFDPNTSTQNLGNLDRVNYTGAEFEVRGRILDGFDGYVGVGFTDSDIKESRRAASDVGNQAPLVSKYTANVGLQYRHSLRSELRAFVRSDVQVIGPTWFYPDNFTERDPVGLLNVPNICCLLWFRVTRCDPMEAGCNRALRRLSSRAQGRPCGQAVSRRLRRELSARRSFGAARG